MSEPQNPEMLDPAATLAVAAKLRSYAKQVRANPTAGLDADVLEKAASLLEQSAGELEALRSEC
jgi:hypothetical protein